MPLFSQIDSFIHIIERMRDPEAIKAFIFNPANQNPDPLFPEFYSWNDLALADGYPSLILLFSTLQRQGIIKENETDVIHICVLKIKEILEKRGCDNFSLFSGISGICFALQQASFEGIRYQKMLNAMHGYLVKNIEEQFLKPMRYNLSIGSPSCTYLHDPIQGLSGIGRYLLEELEFPHFFELSQSILEVLVQFTLPLKVEEKIVPGWYASPNDPIHANHPSLYPKGYFNLGLAHGITGTLAYLAIASLRGIEVKGQKEAIHRVAQWIRQKSFVSHSTIQWPTTISWEEEIGEIAPLNSGCKDAWCYGVPGIARTLFLAGKSLNDNELMCFAGEAFRGVFCRDQSQWGLPGPMLCHGIAGLLLITHEMAKEKEYEDLSSKVVELENLLLSFYHSDFLFGFKDMEPCKNGGLAQVHRIGFLDGVIGVLLTLLSRHDVSKWSLPLLINA